MPTPAASPVVTGGAIGDPTADGIREFGRRIAGLRLAHAQLTLCRAVRAAYLARVPPQPLYHLGSAAYGARYTPLGGPAGLYLASDQPTAYAELQHLFRDASGRLLPLRPQDPVMTIYVEAEVSEVLDLADPHIRRALGVTKGGITGEWRAQMDDYLSGSAPMPVTQQIGHAAHATKRVRGIRFPSARWKGGACMVVFPDRLIARDGDRVEVVDTTGTYAQRIP